MEGITESWRVARLEVWWKSRINVCLEVTEKEMEHEVYMIRKVFTFVRSCLSHRALVFSGAGRGGERAVSVGRGGVTFHLPVSVF